MRCYDTDLFVQVIEEARENADYVIAYVHWGTEYSHELEEAQLDSGKEYIDAGADVVIGAHPHCLQGMEYYKGKPIVYSLGNFWFNNKTLDTMLLNVNFFGDDNNENIELEIIPARQADCRTTIIDEQSEREKLYSFLEEISINVGIDENGILFQTVE